MTLRAAVAGGVCYGVNENLKRSALWPPEFPFGVSEAVRSEIARLYGGVFDLTVYHTIHPGGPAVLKNHAGSDATSTFAEAQESC